MTKFPIIKIEEIQNKIYTFHGVQVMIDRNLAFLYGGTRKLPYAFTEQGVAMLEDLYE